MTVAAGIAVLLSLAVGIGIYNTPANRLDRHLDLANRYLREMKYEQAIVEFDKAIAIDPMSAEAHLGKAEAYVGLDDYDKAIETLENGYLATEEDENIKGSLIAVYKQVLSGEAGKEYEEKVIIYDRLIELGEHGKDVLDDLEKCLEQYIGELLSEGKTDQVRTLIEKYRDLLAGTDFDAFLIEIEMRTKEIGYGSLLIAAREQIIAENYDRVNALYQQKEYQDMIESLQTDESYYYGERDYAGKRNGMGIAVYKGYYGAYFYYGLWREDERNGQGQAVCPTPDDSAVPYKIFMGEWDNDLPNGNGGREIPCDTG